MYIIVCFKEQIVRCLKIFPNLHLLNEKPKQTSVILGFSTKICNFSQTTINYRLKTRTLHEASLQLSPLPERGGEKHEHGEEFQTPYEHEQCHGIFCGGCD